MTQPIVEGDPFGPIKSSKINPNPTSEEVKRFHTNSDVSSSAQALHHRIGTGQFDVNSARHKHNGTDSLKLGDGITISGSKGGNAALTSLIAALVSILGITDATT